MTTKEAVALLERYSNYDGMGIPNLAGCKEAMRVAVDALKEAFPELGESEEERIRKELIGMINECTNWVHKNEYVKYLEKQKESSKSADSIPSDCASDAKCEDRSPKHSDSDGTDIRDTPAYWRGWDDAMKEQKQEWSKEDEKIRARLYEYFQELLKRNEDCYKYGGYVRWEDLDVMSIIAWLKSLRPKSHWKPSEGQMKALQNAVALTACDKELARLYNQLKKL